ncbi:MAG: 2-amino-4-hydroxy-6-hydroxymethyldihydropteridine diphosphokinase [Gammaproteobacteria bacterium]
MRLPSRPDAARAGVAAYIGLGSNLERPAAQVQRAFTELSALPETRLVARSRLYRSRPLGPPNQPDYINAVAALQTRLQPLSLLRALRAIECQHGRQRETDLHWGPRTLDLDMLVYGDATLHTPELILPHPGVHERSFVLYPLTEVAPALVIPGHGPVLLLRDRCRSPAIEMCKETPDE